MFLNLARTTSIEPAVLLDKLEIRGANAREHRACSYRIQGGLQETQGLTAHLERAVAVIADLRVDQHSGTTWYL